MNTNIKTSSGFISSYGFACGYVQKIDKEYLHKELYLEHGIYHVRSTYNNSPELHTDYSGGRASHLFTIWESFTTLTEAKKLYNQIK